MRQQTMMRIITGTAKGRHLKTLQGAEVRPTSERARETLFNILGERVAGARFLDLFAGSGSVAIEALSRGAASAVLVDVNRECVRTIRANLETTGLKRLAQVWQVSAEVALNKLLKQGAQFDMIFCDPPYDSRWLSRIVGWVDTHPQVLAPQGILIGEHHHKTPPPVTERLEVFDMRRVGETQFTFYRRKGTTSNQC
ncbi:MAG: 16S rRNA (guanine(966)-N(2))-methyltransferase RsmD [Abditibacteriales bacterium]|nr:16S rRNA (guanine(966)-N(2))-methyltransferase RsmD [Abditibacteriales bacterium]MDW8366180.1 16S rRNA (guanine(966)-N(2))-methyltransferase RsmD [Abditibacteriales bacterium]